MPLGDIDAGRDGAKDGSRKGSGRRGSMLGMSSSFDPEVVSSCSSFFSLCFCANNDGGKVVHSYRLNSWDFDCFQYEYKDLKKMLFAMFFCYNSDEINFDAGKLRSFLGEVERAYKENPYHCFRHAFDVTQTLFAMIDSPDNNFNFTNIEGGFFFFVVFSSSLSLSHSLFLFEVVSMLLACLIHDVGHPGFNNKYLITVEHELAQRYNDRSVLENFHCARGFEIIRTTGVLLGCGNAVFREIRANVINCIFATDMASHFTLLGKLEQLEHRMDTNGKDEVENSAADKTLLMEALVHTADISNVTKPFDLSLKWANLVTEEFFLQGDMEKEKLLPVEAFMDRERSSAGLNTANFIQFVARKYFVVFANIHAPVKPFLKNMEENFQKLSAMSSSDNGA